MSPLISVSNLRVAFRLGRETLVEAVRGVSFDVPADSTVALVGESGSGKTVSAMSILRLLPENARVDPASRIDFEGENLLAARPERLRRIRGRDITAVFQEPMTSLNPVFTVGDQIAEVLQWHRALPRREALDKAADLMKRTLMRGRSRSRASNSSTCRWIVTSSAVVGSSAISSFGSLAIAMAIITRCCWPPLISCG